MVKVKTSINVDKSVTKIVMSNKVAMNNNIFNNNKNAHQLSIAKTYSFLHNIKNIQNKLY